MLLIWYNPNIDSYEAGTDGEFLLISEGTNSDRFEILYEFEMQEVHHKLASKIAGQLNNAHVMNSGGSKVFV